MSTTVLSALEEDEIIHTRLVNDERAIRRLTRKFHAYSSQCRPPAFASPGSTSVDELRDAFLAELAAYQMFLRKNSLACQSEQRQVMAYLQERDRIANDHERFREDIQNLKQQLEEAQVGRKRKIEYDQVAEKINVLPSRAELDESISALEEEIAALQSDKDLQTSLMNARREKFDQLIDDINELRWMGKDKEAEDLDSPPVEETAERADDGEGEAEGDGGTESDAERLPASSSSTLNPAARSFQPRQPSASGSAVDRLRAAPAVSSPLANSALGLTLGPEASDIEMGEVEEDGGAGAGGNGKDPDEEIDELEEGEEERAVQEPGKRKVVKPVKEELEEGEASDGSSLTELSDD